MPNRKPKTQEKYGKLAAYRAGRARSVPWKTMEWERGEQWARPPSVPRLSAAYRAKKCYFNEILSKIKTKYVPTLSLFLFLGEFLLFGLAILELRLQ